MDNMGKEIEFFKRLIDGVENSNSSAEWSMRKAYDFLHPAVVDGALPDRRMQGYYIGFDKTGSPEIDKILGAVACAGKAVHHTNEWGDEISNPYDDHTGKTPCDWIQNAANEAALSKH